MCVCLFSALSRRVGALQISIIISQQHSTHHGAVVCTYVDSQQHSAYHGAVVCTYIDSQQHSARHTAVVWRLLTACFTVCLLAGRGWVRVCLHHLHLHRRTTARGIRVVLPMAGRHSWRFPRAENTAV